LSRRSMIGSSIECGAAGGPSSRPPRRPCSEALEAGQSVGAELDPKLFDNAFRAGVAGRSRGEYGPCGGLKPGLQGSLGQRGWRAVAARASSQPALGRGLGASASSPLARRELGLRFGDVPSPPRAYRRLRMGVSCPATGRSRSRPRRRSLTSTEALAVLGSKLAARSTSMASRCRPLDNALTSKRQTDATPIVVSHPLFLLAPLFMTTRTTKARMSPPRHNPAASARPQLLH
jgi:hypothetical protein